MARISERAKLRTELAATRLELLQAKRVLIRISKIGAGLRDVDTDHPACLKVARDLALAFITPRCKDCGRHL